MLKYGFFDSVKGDRKYNSKDVAELFDGIIVDGIYAQLYEKFSVGPKRVIETEEDKMTVTVGTGQAWLSHTKILNTSKLELVISESVGVNRYDAIIVEVNDNTRSADIFVKPNVKTKTDDPATRFDLQVGQLVNTEFVHQYLLAVIYVEGGSTRITAENIASKIGFAIPDGIPYVTCPLDPFPADETLKQWVSQWYTFLNGSDAAFKTAQQDRAVQFDNFMSDSGTAFTTAQNNRAAAFTADQNARTTDYQALRQSIVDWLNSTQTDWNTWYASVKDDFEGYVDDSIGAHNVDPNAHPDIRTVLNTLTTRLNTLADSDDASLDQLSEIVAFVKENRTMIEGLTNSEIGLTPNTKNNAGYVQAGGSNVLKAWMTDTNGNPRWSDDLLSIFVGYADQYYNGSMDADDYKRPGVYNTQQNMSHLPEDGWGTLLVLGNENLRPAQMIFMWNSNRVYHRQWNNVHNSWMSWNNKSIKYSNLNFSNFEAIDNYLNNMVGIGLDDECTFFGCVQYTTNEMPTGDPNAPVTTAGRFWWNVIVFGNGVNRITEIAFSCYLESNIANKIFWRTKHDKTWQGWYSTAALENGILPVSKGGTGENNAAVALTNFIKELGEITTVPVDNDQWICGYYDGFSRRPLNTLWGYIETKIKGHTIEIVNIVNGTGQIYLRFEHVTNWNSRIYMFICFRMDHANLNINGGYVGFSYGGGIPLDIKKEDYIYMSIQRYAEEKYFKFEVTDSSELMGVLLAI